VHRSEERTLAECADCGAELQPEGQEGFSFGTRGVLCFDCAMRRGGRYDEHQDRWAVEPSLEGLDEGWD
jgi:hypothetical protein